MAVSGPSDVVTDGAHIWRVSGGSELLTRVTGGGCALGAVVAAVAGALVPDDAWPAPSQAGGQANGQEHDDASAGLPRATRLAWAAVAAHALYSVAAERAAATSHGPGSFAVAFLAALAALDPSDPELGHTARTSLTRASQGEAKQTPAIKTHTQEHSK